MTPAPKNHNYYIDLNATVTPLVENVMKELLESIQANFMEENDEAPILRECDFECDGIMFVQDSDDRMTFGEANDILTKAGWKYLKSTHDATDENRDCFLYMQPDGLQIELNRAALVREARLLLPDDPKPPVSPLSTVA